MREVGLIVAGVFITNQESPELMDALAKTPLPVAVIGFAPPLLKSRKGKTAFVLNDNASIGSTGADWRVVPYFARSPSSFSSPATRSSATVGPNGDVADS